MNRVIYIVSIFLLSALFIWVDELKRRKMWRAYYKKIAFERQQGLKPPMHEDGGYHR